MTSGATYTNTIYAKSAERTQIAINFVSGGFGQGAQVIANLSNGTLGSVTNYGGVTGSSATIQNMGNGWYRISLTMTPVSTTTFYADYSPAVNGNAFYQGNGTSGVYIWGAQIEASSYPTSYIPTTSSSATRVEDVCNKTGVSSLIGQTEGVMFSDFNYKGNAKGSIQIYPFYIGQGTASNSVTIGLFEDALLCRVFVGGTPQNYFTSSTLSVGRHKVAFVYANNNLKLFLDGVLIQTDTSATIPTCDQIYIGASGTTVTTQLIEVNTNALWKTILTDAECIALTTI